MDLIAGFTFEIVKYNNLLYFSLTLRRAKQIRLKKIKGYKTSLCIIVHFNF